MATRQSFRPRPIDSSKPLPIVRSSKDLRHEDDIVVSRALPKLGTGVDAAEMEERHLQQALLASVYGEGSGNKADIPIPVVQNITPPFCPQSEPFNRPRQHYIMFDRSDADLEDIMVDYDADHVDEQFVDRYNADHKKSSVLLTMEDVERTMDALEKLQGRARADEYADASVRSQEHDRKSLSTAVAVHTMRDSEDNLLAYSQIKQELSSILSTHSDACRREVHSHWSRRRISHGGPFHRLYIVPPRPDDPDPSVAFRPRGSEDGGGRRMNTYDNYKRALLLRKEFGLLVDVMKSVVERERTKASSVLARILQTRIQCIVQGGHRVANVSRNIAANEREGYSFGKRDRSIVISCRGIESQLPSGLEAVLSRTVFGSDKKSKKKKKSFDSHSIGAKPSDKMFRVAPDQVTDGKFGEASDKAGRDGNTDICDGRVASVATNQQLGLDSFGFDDHGHRFLKQMRYFAGGFMNYGVSPYDHRVFAAASERNTVKEHCTDPKPFLFPSPSVKFAKHGGTSGSKVKPSWLRGSGITASSCDPNASNMSSENEISIPKKRPRPVKVRGRVGRGGRIVFDRVTYEPERGVKAASYPASIEMGGVYTAGLPLEAARRVGTEEIISGPLGSMSDLGVDLSRFSSHQKLVRPLEPTVRLAEGVLHADGRVTYWPSRKRARFSAERGTQRSSSSDISTDLEDGLPHVRERDGLFLPSQHATQPRRGLENGVYGIPLDEQQLRSLPAYACRDRPLVEEVG